MSLRSSSNQLTKKKKDIRIVVSGLVKRKHTNKFPVVCAMDNYITLTIRPKLYKREMMTGTRIIRHNNGQAYPGAEWVVSRNL